MKLCRISPQLLLGYVPLSCDCGRVLDQCTSQHHDCGRVLDQYMLQRRDCGRVLDQCMLQRRDCGRVLDQYMLQHRDCGRAFLLLHSQWPPQLLLPDSPCRFSQPAQQASCARIGRPMRRSLHLKD